MRTDEIIEEIIKGNQTEEVFKILTDILIEKKTNYKEQEKIERKLRSNIEFIIDILEKNPEPNSEFLIG